MRQARILHRNRFSLAFNSQKCRPAFCGPYIFSGSTSSRIFTKSKYFFFEKNSREVNFIMGTYDLAKKIEEKYISQAIIQKINLTRILWAGRCKTATYDIVYTTIVKQPSINQHCVLSSAPTPALKRCL